LYDSLNTFIFVNDRERGVSNCTSDRRHVVNLTGVAQMPTFANKNLRLLASGWQLAPIYRIQSGNPLSIIAGNGVDSARNGTAAASLTEQLLANIYGDTSGRPFTNWFNTSGCNSNPALVVADKCAFAAPPVGRLGNIRPRTAVGPKQLVF
jgi:hypothetical protein